jgi:hypothetical protein
VSDIRNVIAVIMLMYTISHVLQFPSCVAIHNQCLNTKLVSPVYFCNGAVFSNLPNQQIDIGTKMKAHFEIYTIQDEFEGALLFKLQRYPNRQHNMDTLTKKTNKREAKCVQMLIAYKVEYSKLFLYVTLIEHAKDFTWDENKLKKLYDGNRSWLNEYNNTTSYTWLMDDNMILKTTFSARDLKGIPELSVFISEEEKDSYIMRPLYVDLKR